MIGAGASAPGVAAETSSQAVRFGIRMEAVMRIRRTILAPAILAIGTTGALLVGPVLAVTSATPAAAVAAGVAKPNAMVYHG